jgi:two-component system LytT family sensor kinase
LPIFIGEMKFAFNSKLVKFYLWVALAYAALWFLSNHSAPGTFWQKGGNGLWRVVYVMVVNFIFLEYAGPFIIRKRRFLIYNIFIGAAIVWLFCIVWAYGLYSWRLFGISLHIYTELVTYKSKDAAITAQMGYSVGSIFFFGTIRHIYNYIKLRQSAQRLRIEKQAAELNYLKSQTNPHFLFNTLNNIYSLARDKNDLAPESILRLSKILRFMLYETGGDYIAIEQELKIIDDYIALEKLRYDESLRINFNYDIEDMKQALPPLLLMPLVENAFKHGASETRSRPFVDIHLSVHKRQLIFIVKNSAETFSRQEAIKENIGLANLRRQLELLYTDYDLSVKQEDSVFVANLTINLASHVKDKMHHH